MECKFFSDADLFQYIGGEPERYLGTFYVPHHFSHMEYILHYGGMDPGIVLVVDGSGSLEEDRDMFNVDEARHPDIMDFTHFAGKEVISAYFFDGLKSSLIYRFSPSCAPSEKYNADLTGSFKVLDIIGSGLLNIVVALGMKPVKLWVWLL